MKIFISWSGDRSKQIAVALNKWIKMVLQATEPWISTNDIDGGSVWFNKITEQLKDSQTSIICLTPENVNEPWILFEAGAVAKGVEANRVCTLLIGLSPTDVRGPLAQFNHTLCNKDGLRKLLYDLNKRLKQQLDEIQFNNVFDALWPALSPAIDGALKKPSSAAPTKKDRSSEDMLAEILERIRTVENQTARVETAAGFVNSLNFPSDMPAAVLREVITNEFIEFLNQRMASEQNAIKDLKALEMVIDREMEKFAPKLKTHLKHKQK